MASGKMPVIDALALVRTNMKIYGEEVNLERSVPDFRDGLKPVARRVLVSMNDIMGLRSTRGVKTAKVAGHCIGTYHPHADTGASDAAVTQVNLPFPPIEGIGNWGTLVSGAGSPRYTNVAFTNYGRSFFSKHYHVLVDKVPNYDSSTKEPLCLAALFPNILFQGIMGIGVGIRTSIPAFTPISVLKLMNRLLEGEKLTPEDYARSLKFVNQYGGCIAKTKENFKAAVELFSGTKGSIRWKSPLTIDEDTKSIIIDAFAPNVNPVDVLDKKVKLIPEVKSVYSGKGLSYVVEVDRKCNMAQFNAVVAKVDSLFSTSMSYDIYVTERNLVDAESGKYKVDFHNLSIPNLVIRWLKWRLKLEADSLDYQIKQAEDRINFLNLLVLACDNLKIIFDAIRTQAPAAYLVKNLEISLEDANVILDRKVRNLSKMDKSKLQAELKTVKDHHGKLKIKRKSPRKEVIAFFQHSITQIEAYQKFAGTRQFKLKAVPASVNALGEEDSEEVAEE